MTAHTAQKTTHYEKTSSFYSVLNTIPINPKYRSPSRAAIFACYHADEGTTIGRTSCVFYVAFTAPLPACYALPPHPIAPRCPLRAASPCSGTGVPPFSPLRAIGASHPFLCSLYKSHTMRRDSSTTAGRKKHQQLPHPRYTGSYHPHPRLHHRLPARCGLPPIAALRGAPRGAGWAPRYRAARLFPLRFAIAGIHAEQPPAARPSLKPSTLAPPWPCAGGALFPSQCRLRGARGTARGNYGVRPYDGAREPLAALALPVGRSSPSGSSLRAAVPACGGSTPRGLAGSLAFRRLDKIAIVYRIQFY